MDQPHARAALWSHNPDIAFMIPLALAHAGIAVSVVESAEALLAAGRQDDCAFLIIDCAAVDDAAAHCRLVLPHTALPIHICHPLESFVADLAPLAQGPLVWLPPSWTALPLIEKARALLAQAEIVPVVAAPAPALTPSLLTERQRQVQGLVYTHHSNAQIAAQLGIAPRTVKNHIAEGMSRLDLHSRRAFGAAYDPSRAVHDL